MEDIEHVPSSVENVIADNGDAINEDSVDSTKIKVLENITLDFYLDTFAEDEIPSIYLPPFLKSPSECRGMSQEEEHKFRIFGCELIQESGILLRLPQGATCMAQFIFHRFYYKRSFLEADVRTFSSACLFLATKIEETSRKLRDIVSVVDYALKLKNKSKPTEILDLSSQLYLNMRQDVVDAERLILKELGFQVYRLDMSHPHKYILNYIRMLKGNKYLAQRAWSYINDSYRSPLCVFYRPNVVAAAAIYLAARFNDFPLPELEWWLVFDAPWDEIEEICAEILSLYEQPKIELSFITETVEKYEPKEKIVDEPVIVEHGMQDEVENQETNGHTEHKEETAKVEKKSRSRSKRSSSEDSSDSSHHKRSKERKTRRRSSSSRSRHEEKRSKKHRHKHESRHSKHRRRSKSYSRDRKSRHSKKHRR